MVQNLDVTDLSLQPQMPSIFVIEIVRNSQPDDHRHDHKQL